jgi:hypothetical protein
VALIQHTMTYVGTSSGRNEFELRATLEGSEGYLIGHLVMDPGWPTTDGPIVDPVWTSGVPAQVLVSIDEVSQ